MFQSVTVLLYGRTVSYKKETKGGNYVTNCLLSRNRGLQTGKWKTNRAYLY
jgi:hypothetical protein